MALHATQGLDEQPAVVIQNNVALGDLLVCDAALFASAQVFSLVGFSAGLGANNAV